MSYGQIYNRDGAIVSSFHCQQIMKCFVVVFTVQAVLCLNMDSSTWLTAHPTPYLPWVLSCFEGGPLWKSLGQSPWRDKYLSLWVHQKSGYGINNISLTPPSLCWWHYIQPTPLKVVWMPYFTEELREDMLNYRLNLTFCNSQFPTAQMIFPKNTLL